MKKNYVFLLVFVALFIISSCEQDELTAQTEQVNIFLYAPQASDSLKSLTIEKRPIVNGDTVLLHTRDVNALLWAEDKYGEAIKGAWNAKLVETDYSKDFPDYPLRLVFGYSGADYISQISFKLPEFGLYEISVGKFQDKYNRTGRYSEITFYIKVVGIPGLVGDDFQDKYIFRMEKKHFIKEFVAEDVFIIYYKYNGNYKDYFCSLGSLERYPVIQNRGAKMKEWPYNRPGDNYRYAVIKGLSGTYALNFMGTDDQCNDGCGINDQNAYKSSWWDEYNRGIILTIP